MLKVKCMDGRDLLVGEDGDQQQCQAGQVHVFGVLVNDGAEPAYDLLFVHFQGRSGPVWITGVGRGLIESGLNYTVAVDNSDRWRIVAIMVRGQWYRADSRSPAREVRSA